MFIFRGHLNAPIHLYASYICTPPYVQTPPVCPQYFPMYRYVQGSICMCYWDAEDPYMLDTPLRGSGCLPMCPTPPCIVCSPVSLCILGDICRFYGQNPLYLGGLWGVSTPVRLLVSVSKSLGCPLCSSCAFF